MFMPLMFKMEQNSSNYFNMHNLNKIINLHSHLKLVNILKSRKAWRHDVPSRQSFVSSNRAMDARSQTHHQAGSRHYVLEELIHFTRLIRFKSNHFIKLTSKYDFNFRTGLWFTHFKQFENKNSFFFLRGIFFK